MKTIEPVVCEVLIDADPARVWKALTEKDQMKMWYFDLAAFEPRVGFEFRFDVRHKEKEYIHVCQVTEVESGKKITYTWGYDGFEGTSYVTFELIPEGPSTK